MKRRLEMRKTLPLVVSLLILSATSALADWDQGVAAFTSKNWQQAVSEFQELVKQNPEGWRGYYMLGLSLEQLNRKEEALHNLRKAYDLNPNELSVKLALGRAYSTLRRYGDVTSLLGSVDVSSLPAAQQAAFYQIRGAARSKTHDDSGALKDFEQLVKLKPNDAQVQYSYGSMALSADRLDTAIAAIKKAVQLDPKDADMKRTYVQTLVRKGRVSQDKAAKKSAYAEAARLAKELAAAAPTYDNYMLQLSAELGAGLYEQAIATGKAALGKKNTDWLAHYYLGQAYTSAKQYEEAERPLLTAKEKAAKPDDLKQVWRQLGYTYEKQKKYSKSIEAYQFAGDAAGVTRVTENEKTDSFNKQVEEENKIIKEMEEEAKKLEEELKELEGGG
jgi:tetratricopeptide (TPR) repeat protein